MGDNTTSTSATPSSTSTMTDSDDRPVTDAAVNGDDIAVATQDMCLLAFSRLLARLKPSLASSMPAVSLPMSRGGVFVTWSMPRSRDGETSYTLRGCIGTLRQARIDTAVAQYATHAAFNDPRFDPIDRDELPGLKVGVSILSRFERACDVFDWTVGTHGIILEFDSGRHSATYLPEVACEHNWTKEYCVQSLAEKAGFRGLFEGRVRHDAVVTRYQSTKIEMTYEQYTNILIQQQQPLHHR